MINYSILQIDLDQDKDHYVFSSKSFTLSRTDVSFPPPAELYNETYRSSQDEFDPEIIFYVLNMNHPKDYRTRSLSISDIIRFELPNGQFLNLFCDRIGFTAIDFGDEYQVAKAAEYTPGADSSPGSTTLFYTKTGIIRSVQIKISDILAKSFTGTDEDGREISLTPGEVYEALLAYYRNDPVLKQAKDPLNFRDQFTALIF